jgi:holo-[acyl-carrier protein] synthase
MTSDEGVVAEGMAFVEVAEVERLLRGGGTSPFSAAELEYARSKSDPERRLAARLAAKRAASRLLGDGFAPEDVEVVRGRGAPTLRFSPAAAARLAALGASRALVSLTHERKDAAASVLLLRDPG